MVYVRNMLGFGLCLDGAGAVEQKQAPHPTIFHANTIPNPSTLNPKPGNLSRKVSWGSSLGGFQSSRVPLHTPRILEEGSLLLEGPPPPSPPLPPLEVTLTPKP